MSPIFKKMNAQKNKSLCLFSFFISGDRWKTDSFQSEALAVHTQSPLRVPKDVCPLLELMQK